MALASFRWRRILRTSISTILGCSAIGAVGTMGLSALLNWDPSGVVASPGGAGTWDYTTTIWDNSGTLVKWTDTTGLDTGVFKGTGALVSLAAPITVGGLRFDVTGYTIGSASDSLTLITPTTAAPLITSNAASVLTTIAASIGGNDGLAFTAGAFAGTKTTLSANNNFVGGVTITSGTVELGNAGALNQSIPNTLSFGSVNPAALALKGNSVAIRDLQGATSSSSISNGLAGNATLTIYQQNDQTVKTILSDGTGTLSLLKDGPGTLTLGSDNTYSGATTVRGTTQGGTVGGTESGTLELAGNNVGRLTATSSISISDAGTLKLTNTSSANSGDRIPTAPINMRGGSLVFANDASAANFAETTGALNIIAGANNIFAQQAASGRTSILTFASLVRTAASGSVVRFQSQYQFTDLPSQIGITTQDQIVLTAAPALNDLMIGGWALFEDRDFATYNTTTFASVKIVAPTVDQDQSLWATTSNQKVTQVGTIMLSDLSPFNGTRTINSLNLAADPLTLNLGGLTLNLDTGGLISQVQTLFGGSIDNGSLTAGTAANSELFLHVPNANGTLTITASIVNNGISVANPIGNLINLVKAGPGAVILSGASGYTGSTSIIGGTLQVDKDGELGSGTGAVTLRLNDGTLGVINVGVTTSTFTLDPRRTIEVGGNSYISVAAGTTGHGTTFSLTGGTITSVTSGSLTFLSNATDQPEGAVPGTINVTLAGALLIGGSLRIDAATQFRPSATTDNIIGRSLQVGMNGSALFFQGGKTLTVGSGIDDTLDLGVKDENTSSSAASVNKSGTLTLTGVTLFTAKVDKIRIGVQLQTNESLANGTVGVATLATSNELVAGTSITISDNANSTGTALTTAALTSKVDFGAGMNNVTTRTMLIGGSKGTAIVGVATGGTLNLKGFGERTLNLSIGRNDSPFGSITSTGTLDVTHLSNGTTVTTNTTFIGSFDNLIIGQKTSSTLTGAATGTLILGSSASNNVVANTVKLGVDTDFNQTTATAATGFGTLTMGGGAFTVYNDVALATQGLKGIARAILNISGGTFSVGGNITKTNSDLSNAVINLSGGTLKMINPLVNDQTSGTITASLLNYTGGSLTNAASVTLDGRGLPTSSTPNPLTNALVIQDVSLPAPLNLTGTVANMGGVQYTGTGAGATLASVSLGSVARTFDIGNSNSAIGDLTVTGAVTGTGLLTKKGAGTVLFNGSVAGPAKVIAGELGGTGTMAAVSVSYDTTSLTQGTLSPAGSGVIGTLSTGALTFDPAVTVSSTTLTSTLKLDLNSVSRTSDKVAITGNLTLAGDDTTVLSLTDLNAVSTYAFFALSLVDYSGSRNAGRFTVPGVGVITDYDAANPTASQWFTVNNNQYAIDYDYNGGHTIALIAVPEPASLALLAGGVALLGGVRRRRVC